MSADDMLFVIMGRESSIPKYHDRNPIFGLEFEDDDEYVLCKNLKREEKRKGFSGILVIFPNGLQLDAL